MKSFGWVQFAALIVLLSVTVIANTTVSQAQTAKDASCSNTPNLDHPHVTLNSGDLHLVVFLPDAKHGYYRAQRFDWSGVIGCASYKGHTYWGQWFRHYDPEVNDAITGPVEEFRPDDGAQGYDSAQSGGTFVKIGVGVLRKTSNAPYRFGDSFPIVDTGRWNVHVGKRSITFQQRLTSPNGINYLYTKKLILSRDGSVLTLHHTLKNLGGAPLVTNVYDHDFFMLDAQPTGPGFVLHLAFAPVPQTPPQPGATVKGNDIVYLKELGEGDSVASYLTGYGSTASDYDIRLENKNTHTGIEQTGSMPISRFYLWSIHSTICPEAYLHLDIASGKTEKWDIHYHFLANLP
ncbi:MAG TPA: hypothetical protein VE195_01755 [Acidobacteriaceae bacterium]|nr:hypothetical protein [Acidobacteriaceae bacterium]